MITTGRIQVSLPLRAQQGGQRGVIPQRLLSHGVALGMYILQRGEKQQLLRVKEFIERALGYADRLGSCIVYFFSWRIISSQTSSMSPTMP